MGMNKYKRHGDYNASCGLVLFAASVFFILALAIEMLASYVGW